MYPPRVAAWATRNPASWLPVAVSVPAPSKGMEQHRASQDLQHCLLEQAVLGATPNYHSALSFPGRKDQAVQWNLFLGLGRCHTFFAVQ